MDLSPEFFLQHQDLLIVLLVGILLGIVIGLFIRSGKIRTLEKNNAELDLTLQLEQKNKRQMDELLSQTREQLANTFNQLSNEALTRNNTSFLRLAEENLKRFQSEAKADLGSKEKAIEQMLKPINEALQQTSKQIQEIEKDRKEAYGSLNTTITQMNLSQQQLQQETQNLVQALRRPEVRGQWGEMTLKRLAELSVDAKTPLDAYLSAIQAKDDMTRKLELKRHAQIIRGRIKELSRKNYWAEYSQSPEFVVLFIPGEQFLSAALEVDPALLEDSMSQNIILATPTNFIALLRAVSYGWKQQALAENAEIIRELGETLYKRLATFGNHLSKLGNSLGQSVNHFNSAVGSLERQVLPGARKFIEMGISTKSQITDLPPLEQQPRQVQDKNDAD